MISEGDVPRELSELVVPLAGSLEATGDLFLPYRLVDGDGAVVEPVTAFFAELAACGRSVATQRSYGMDLLRWFRFLWAIGVGWDQATRVEGGISAAGYWPCPSRHVRIGGIRLVVLRDRVRQCPRRG